MDTITKPYVRTDGGAPHPQKQTLVHAKNKWPQIRRGVSRTVLYGVQDVHFDMSSVAKHLLPFPTANRPFIQCPFTSRCRRRSFSYFRNRRWDRKRRVSQDGIVRRTDSSVLVNGPVDLRCAATCDLAWESLSKAQQGRFQDVGRCLQPGRFVREVPHIVA
jgi:hypothetical protein